MNQFKVLEYMGDSISLTMLSFLLFTLLAFSGTSNADFSDETKKLISDWAPLIWIHSEDPFLPSNIDFYLDNMEVTMSLFNQIQSLSCNTTHKTIIS